MALHGMRILLVGAALVLLVAYFAKPNFPDSASNHGLKTLVGLGFKTIELVSYSGGLIGLSPVNITRTMLGVSAVFNKKRESVQISSTQMDGVEVMIFQPATKSDSLRPGIVHYHGGGWVHLSPELYKAFIEEVVDQTQSVVVSVNYRRAPEHLYPIPLEDCLTATRYFLRNAEKFGVDRNKVGVKGDSAGGNLAMAAALKLSQEEDLSRLKFMSLDYPALQFFDFDLPCYRKYENGPGFLTKRTMVKYMLLYAFGHTKYFNIVYRNQHVDSASRKKYENLVNENLVPKTTRDDAPKRKKIDEQSELDKNIQNEIIAKILDPLYAPLMASDEELKKLPPAYVFNAEFDVLRDDGFILAARLQKLGVKVVHEHLTTEEHGFLNFVAIDQLAREQVKLFAAFFNETLGIL